MDLLHGTASLVEELDSKFTKFPIMFAIIVFQQDQFFFCDFFLSLEFCKLNFNELALISFIFCFFSASEHLLVILRDGRKLTGILRSFDQFGTKNSH